MDLAIAAECLHGDVTSRSRCADSNNFNPRVVCEALLFVQIAHEENDVAYSEFQRMRRRIFRIQCMQILGRGI